MHPNRQPALTLGILSGTSVDAIDVALVEWSINAPPILRASAEYAWDRTLQRKLLQLPEHPHISLQTLGELNTACGQAFAQVIQTFISDYGLNHQEIAVIGSHGQTIWHSPQGKHPFSLQIGHPAIIAKQTGIPTAGDFRMDDIALNGQGAPLAPALHRLLFAQPNAMVAILNLGGIANISLCYPDGRSLGFDTGPANTLLDAWYRKHHPHSKYRFDMNGQWANSAEPDNDLVHHLLQHPFFQQPIPKSTGREDFSLAWLEAQLIQLNRQQLSPAIIQSSLLTVTVESIARSLQGLPSGQLWLCGGGVQNTCLINKLAHYLPNWVIAHTDQHGYPSNALEAMLFSYLGYMRLHNQPIDLKEITGQSRCCVLGGLWLAS